MNRQTRFPSAILAAFLAALLAGSLASAALAQSGTHTEQWGSLIITRTAPEQAQVGKQLWVVIQVENVGAEGMDLRFIESLGDADFDRAQAKATRIYDPGYSTDTGPTSDEGFDLWTYEWHLRLAAGQKTSMAYWLVPLRPGLYVIPSAQLILVDGQVYRTAAWTITVACIVDGMCSQAEGENAWSCPDDCASGASDSYCDGIPDGRVDPDCEPGHDPDEAVPTVAPTPEETRRLPLKCLGPGSMLALAPVALVTARQLRRRGIPHRKA